MLDQPSELVINATAFKARCLGLMDDLAHGRLGRVMVTKRGKVIAEMRAPHLPGEKVSIIGCMANDVANATNIDWNKVEGEAASLADEWLAPDEMDARFQRQSTFPR